MLVIVSVYAHMMTTYSHQSTQITLTGRNLPNVLRNKPLNGKKSVLKQTRSTIILKKVEQQVGKAKRRNMLLFYSTATPPKLKNRQDYNKECGPGILIMNKCSNSDLVFYLKERWQCYFF